MNEYAYRISEDKRIVERLSLDGEVRGMVSFLELEDLWPDTRHYLKRVWPKEVVDLYYIARDELIDRGLIQDKGE